MNTFGCKTFRPLAAGTVLALLLAAPAAAQQQKIAEDPHIGFVYPAGGQPGTSFEGIIGGEYLENVSEIYVSGGGVHVKVVKFFHHVEQNRIAGLTTRRKQRAYDRLMDRAERAGKKDYKPTQAEIMKEADYSEYELEQIADYRKRAAEPRRQVNPQLMEDLRLVVTVDKDAKPGDRELRVITPGGMSNPMWFMISQLPEVQEVEPNDETTVSTIRGDLPMVINGQVMPGDVDRFAIHCRKGQHVVASVAARALIPYLADAVPGWFQAVVAMYDPKGREVAYAGEFGWRQDPVIFYEVPADGDYTLEIRDSIYRGREDFVYRITVGEMPFITGVFPLGGRAGTKVDVDLAGWNLPIQHLTLDNFYDRGRPVRPISVKGPELISNRVLFAVDMQPEVLEREPNNDPATAQAVTLPMIINGRIDPPDDCDTFKFEGHAGEKVVAEVVARRLGSPLDSLLKLFDAGGKQLAVNDDNEDRASPLATHHADSRIEVKLPASGTYYVRLYDAQRKGGPDFAYRLQIRPPRPDFELRVVPSSVVCKAAGSSPIEAHAVRRDGFSDDIYLELDAAPPGYKISGAWIPAGQDMCQLTLTAPPNPTAEPIHLEMQGRATIHGTRIVRPAIPSENMMQAFAYHHLVPAKDWTIDVIGTAGTKPAVLWLREEKGSVRDGRLRIPVGKTAQIRMSAPGKPFSELRFELHEPPDGITIAKSAADHDAALLSIQAEDPARVGVKGNILCNVYWEHETFYDGKAQQKKTLLGMLPAISFEVIK